jgi:hypothetical protein
MIATLHFATLVITTVFAAAAAAGLLWLFLQATFVMMRPATVRRISMPTGLVRGTSQLARAFASNRWEHAGRWKEGSNSMLVLKYLLMILGVGLFGSASALAVYDVFLAAQLRRLLRRNTTDESGADLNPRAPRYPLRTHFMLRVNFIGGNAGHGLR